MARFIMQARSSETGQLITWLSDGAPDFAGSSFPGPGSPEEIAATAYGSLNPGDQGPPGPPGPPGPTGSAIAEGQNVGEGAEVFKVVVGTALHFRRIKGENGILVSEDGDTIVVDGSEVEGGGGTPGGDNGDIQINDNGEFAGLGGDPGVIIRRNNDGTAWITEEPLELPQGGGAGYVLTRGATPDDLSWTQLPEGLAVPSGTGFRRVTDGTEELTAAAVELDGGSTHVTGVLPVDHGGTGLDVSDLTGQAGKAMVVSQEEDGYTFVSIPEGATVPTGTGFRRVTNGVEESAAEAVDLAGGSTYVTGVLPADNGGTGLDESDLSGNAGKALVVNEGEDGFTFLTIPAGATVPTGTGFRHVTGGVEDAAAKLVENADVATNAAIDVTKLATGTLNYQVLMRWSDGQNRFELITNNNIATNAAIDVTKLQAGSSNTVLNTSSTGVVNWSQLNLGGGHFTGTLPVNRGGTGLTAAPGSNGNPIINSVGVYGAATNWVFNASGGLVGGSGSYISVGSGTQPASGGVRLTADLAIVGRYSAGDRTIALGANDGTLFVGTNAAFSAQWVTLRLYSSSVYLGRGNATDVAITSTGVSIQPGGTQRAFFSSSDAYLVHGTGTIGVQSSSAYITKGNTIIDLASSRIYALAAGTDVLYASNRGVSFFSSSERIPSGVAKALYLPNGSAPDGHWPTPGAGQGGYLVAEGDHLYWVNKDGATPIA